MSPDPPVDPVDGCLSCSYDIGIALHSSDDSEGDTGDQAAYEGYTLLGQQEPVIPPQDNEHFQNLEDDDVSDSVIPCDDIYMNQVVPPAGRADLISLWNTPISASSVDIKMDDERSAQIRAAMAGFSLPASSVPAWAANIPEEQWKKRLLDKLQQSGDINVPQCRK